MPYIQRIKLKKNEIIVLLIFVYELSFPHTALAAEATTTDIASIMLPQYVIASSTKEAAVAAAPEEVIIEVKAPQPKVIRTYTIPVTAYNSLPGQTDGSPCITANGFNLCKNNQENVIAANFLKFGTKVRIPKYFGDRIFTVQDRMNARYYYKADIWMKNYSDAIKFGTRTTVIEVIE
jgi:3D (Asp-Asp-Asp) domain-containing protein